MRGAAVFATLATAVSAVTFHVEAVENYDWDITNWSAGCAMSGCYYDFNVSGPADSGAPARPAFLAYCSGQGEGGAYAECDLLDEAEVSRVVVAKLLPSISSNTTSNTTDVIARVQVSFKYTDLQTSTTWWNFTGHGNASYNQFVAPVLNFTIKPDTITGAA